MMSGVIAGELRVVGTAFLSGAFITFVYDLLRIFRRAVLHGNVWIGAEDAVFWIWAAFWIFSVLYRENDGSFRSYTLLSMAAGMLLYNRTVSGTFVSLTGMVLRKAVLLLSIPFGKLKKALLFCGNGLKKNTKGIIVNILHKREKNDD